MSGRFHDPAVSLQRSFYIDYGSFTSGSPSLVHNHPKVVLRHRARKRVNRLSHFDGITVFLTAAVWF
jgi:hypothetical protein